MGVKTDHPLPQPFFCQVLCKAVKRATGLIEIVQNNSMDTELAEELSKRKSLNIYIKDKCSILICSLGFFLIIYMHMQ